MKAYLLFVFLLCLPVYVDASQLTITPAEIAAGNVALLRFNDRGAVTGEVEFNGRRFALDPTLAGGQALLGTDLAMAPGRYPVRVRLAGSDVWVEKLVQVVTVPRPEERITLPEQMVSPKDPEVLKRIEREQALLKDLFAGQREGKVPVSFQLPVDDPIGSPFGLRRILNGQPRSPHAGIDFRSPRGTPIKVSAAGEVVYLGDLYFTGMTVVVDHGSGLFSLYCHLDQIDCVVGQFVRPAEVLGRVGSTGRSTGAHLHWGVKLRGDRVDPLALVTLLGGENP